MIDALFVDKDKWPVFFQVTWHYMKTGTVIIPVIALLWLVQFTPLTESVIIVHSGYSLLSVLLFITMSH